MGSNHQQKNKAKLDSNKTQPDLSDLKAQRFQSETEGLINDNDARRAFSKCIFDFILLWFILALVIFIAVGKGALIYSDNVLIAFITAIFGTPVGLLAIVFKYFFKK